MPGNLQSAFTQTTVQRNRSHPLYQESRNKQTGKHTCQWARFAHLEVNCTSISSELGIDKKNACAGIGFCNLLPLPPSLFPNLESLTSFKGKESGTHQPTVALNARQRSVEKVRSPSRRTVLCVSCPSVSFSLVCFPSSLPTSSHLSLRSSCNPF